MLDRFETSSAAPAGASPTGRTAAATAPAVVGGVALPVSPGAAGLWSAGALLVGFVGGALVAVGSGGGEEAAASGSSPTAAPAAVLQPVGASATCQSDEGREADGSPVTYGPELVLDDDPATAWRCPGDGVGQRLTVDLGGPATVTEVAVVPGYAKTDPADGTDRYAQNRRLTKVRWLLDGGVSVEQTLDPAPEDRELQRVAVPAVTSSTVALEVLESSDGSRDTVAVSTVVVSGRPG